MWDDAEYCGPIDRGDTSLRQHPDAILAHFIGLVSAEASACWAQWQWRYMKNLDNALEFMRSTHRLRSIFVGFEELIQHYAIFQ